MKLLRTTGILIIVAGLVLGVTGSASAKNPNSESHGGGNAHGKSGLFGTVISVESDGDGGYIIELDTDLDAEPDVNLNVNGNTKYKAPGQTKGWITEIEASVIENIEGKRIAALVQYIDESTADALRLMLIKITPPQHAHHVGIVTEFTGAGGIITITDNKGVSHTFNVSENVVYHPDETTYENIVPDEVCVTVVTKGDPKADPQPSAKAIVLHEELPEWAE